MLSIENISVDYGVARVIWNVSARVERGQIVAVMGPNGSGKSTLFKAVMGMAKVVEGRIRLDNQDITNAPTHSMVGRGVSFVLERRRLFGSMTVEENLRMGAYDPGARSRYRENLELVESLLPIVRSARHKQASSLSGGQQQLVAIGRGLMSAPRLLILDEPLLGLAPKAAEEVMTLLKQLSQKGITILFNEQNVRTAFGNSDRGYILEVGRVVLNGSGMEMLDHPIVRQVYMGETVPENIAGSVQ